MNFAFVIWVACFIEIITYILRFGCDFHSRSIQKKAKLPLRIHHMYVGFFLMIPGLFWSAPFFADFLFQGATITLLDIGLAIAFSDMIHHFAILPLFHQKMDFP